MIYTSYCNVAPIAAELERARRSMSPEDQVDIEDAFQRWGKMGPEEAHIYARVSDLCHVLARRVPIVGRFLVGVRDFGRNRIVAVAMDTGPIEKAVQPAFLYIGPLGRAPVINPRWTG